MITSLAQILAEFLQDELPILDSAKLSHAPTIGAMYEGLSGEILERAIPINLGLRVVTGFLTDGNDLSPQIDRMLVRGEGLNLPHTDVHVWHLRDAIAVFEIKKTLMGTALFDAVAHLAAVRDLELEWFRQPLLPEDDHELKRPRLAATAFEQMTGMPWPSPGQDGILPLREQAIFHSLFQEQYAIIRIALGHHGYKTEAGLRRGFINSLEMLMKEGGFPPTRIPQLIISGSYSLVKANGQPYVAPLVDGEWPILSSSSANPILLMLELIWSRLDHLFGLGNPWGEDLNVELMRKLLLAEAREGGWTYYPIDADEKALREIPDEEGWMPSFVGETEFILLTELCSGRELSSSDSDLAEWLHDRGTSIEEMTEALIATRLVIRDADRLVLATEFCVTAILPDGKFVAAEDSTGRLSRWMLRSDRESLK